MHGKKRGGVGNNDYKRVNNGMIMGVGIRTTNAASSMNLECGSQPQLQETSLYLRAERMNKFKIKR